MGKRSTSWKDLEKLVAQELKGTRVQRGADFSRSDVDVIVPDFPTLRVDAKYRQATWSHHKYLAEVKTKYSRDDLDIPILATKNHNERGAVISIYLSDFAAILDSLRELRAGDQRRGQKCPSTLSSARPAVKRRKPT